MGLREQLSRLLGRSRSTAAGASEPTLNDDELHDLLEAVQTSVGHRFSDASLLHHALVHRSHAHVTGASRLQTNERLEFLGDAVLGALTSEYLFRRFPDREEGELTRMKARLVCGASLSRVAGSIGLGDHVLMSRGEAATGGRERASILADTVEAILGAVYLDGGYEAARNVLERWLLQDADEFLDHEDLVNNKSRLQELIQGRFKAPPRYKVIAVEGPDHDRRFRIQVSVRDLVLGSGDGRAKKTAEQRAAAEALAALEADPELLERDHDERGR